jgi:hypothetical protein
VALAANIGRRSSNRRILSFGDAFGGPPCGRLDERVLRRVLRDGEVADVAHEYCHQPWPLVAEDVGDTHQTREQTRQQTRRDGLVSRRTP